MKPMEIEQASMAIIERELQVALDPEIKPIVKRVIHATADFSFAESMVFTPGVVPYARELLARGAMIVTDTQMALSGISKPALKKLGCQAVCFMADEDIAREAKARETTRGARFDGARAGHSRLEAAGLRQCADVFGAAGKPRGFEEYGRHRRAGRLCACGGGEGDAA